MALGLHNYADERRTDTINAVAVLILRGRGQTDRTRKPHAHRNSRNSRDILRRHNGIVAELAPRLIVAHARQAYAYMGVQAIICQKGEAGWYLSSSSQTRSLDNS